MSSCAKIDRDVVLLWGLFFASCEVRPPRNPADADSQLSNPARKFCNGYAALVPSVAKHRSIPLCVQIVLYLYIPIEEPPYRCALTHHGQKRHKNRASALTYRAPLALQ